MYLVEEVDICGPAHARWMYPMKMYLKALEGYVWNHATPQVNLGEGYAIDEALHFCREYMQLYTITSRRVWDDMEDPIMNDEILEGVGRPKILTHELQLDTWICDE